MDVSPTNVITGRLVSCTITVLTFCIAELPALSETLYNILYVAATLISTLFVTITKLVISILSKSPAVYPGSL